jgi:hypothetical protein
MAFHRFKLLEHQGRVKGSSSTSKGGKGADKAKGKKGLRNIGDQSIPSDSTQSGTALNPINGMHH